jgi:hypothetical protein
VPASQLLLEASLPAQLAGLHGRPQRSGKVLDDPGVFGGGDDAEPGLQGAAASAPGSPASVEAARLAGLERQPHGKLPLRALDLFKGASPSQVALDPPGIASPGQPACAADASLGRPRATQRRSIVLSSKTAALQQQTLELQQALGGVDLEDSVSE